MRDSAGIRIFENHGAAWGPNDAWTLSSEPVLEIGKAEGEAEYLFSGVSSVRRLTDGRIAVLDLGSAQLRLFNAKGRHERTFGRYGEGPGEFVTPAGLIEGPDSTLVVWDAQLRRATAFKLADTVAQTVRFPDAPGVLRVRDLRGFFSDGSAFVLGVPSAEDVREALIESGPSWYPYVLARYTNGGTSPAVLGVAYGPQCDPGMAGQCSILAYGSRRDVAFHSEWLYLAFPDRNEIRRLDPNGKIVALVRGTEPLQPVTDGMKDAFRAAVVAGYPQIESQVRQYLDQASFAHNVPAFASLLISRDGYLWTQAYRVETASFGYRPTFPKRTDPVSWTVYDPEGRQLGVVLIPVDCTVFDIGANYILGVARDQLGIEQVRMYELLKPAA